jgi:hypothetical protein
VKIKIIIKIYKTDNEVDKLISAFFANLYLNIVLFLTPGTNYVICICLFLNAIVELLLFYLYMSVIPINIFILNYAIDLFLMTFCVMK